MNYSSYIEELYEASLNKPQEQGTSKVSEPMEPVELSQEEIDRLFFDFEKDKVFIGTFNGEGTKFKIGEKDFLTWSFNDRNGLPWLIPQWSSLNESQGNFQGFSKENPGEFLYYIEYVELIQTPNGVKHKIKVFRKLSEGRTA